MGLENLNARAANSFEKVKRKKGWTIKIVEEAAKSDSSINANKLQKMLNETPPARVEVDKIVNHLTDKFHSAEVSPMDFIDSLGLSANLSIAVAALIEYGKKGNKKNLEDAIGYIRKEIENG